MSQHFGSVSPLSEHPASPALLTSHGPHRHLCSDRKLIQSLSSLRRLQIGSHRVAPCTSHIQNDGDRQHAWAAPRPHTHSGGCRFSHSGQASIADRSPQLLFSCPWVCCLRGATLTGDDPGAAPSLRLAADRAMPWGVLCVCGCGSHPHDWDLSVGCLGAHQGPPRTLPIRLHMTSHSHSKHAQKPRENRVVAHTASRRCEEACLRWVRHAHSQFEDRSRSSGSPELPLMRCFTGRNHFRQQTCFAFEPSYPEGNFEGNQLLGGSIGLSPLCRTQATRFARQNSDRPPPQFPMASP